MKKTVFIIFFGIVSNIFSQDIDTSMFSNFNLTILGGANFNSIPTIGGSIIIEGKTNISPNVDLKISVGYSSLFEDKDYIIKSYKFFNIENTEGYQLTTYSIDKIEYSIVPVSMGMEYTFINSKFSPVGIFEIEYGFYMGEERISQSTSGEVFNNMNDVPAEYENEPPRSFDETAIGIGVGFGFKYRISSSLNLDVRYMFRYNDSIVNTNQILFGITF